VRPRVFWPLILILIGVVLLLDNLHLLPGSIWSYFWPLALLALGVSLLAGALRGAPPVKTTSERLPLEGAGVGNVTIMHGAGRLKVHAGDDPSVLLAGTFGGGVDKRVQRSGDLLDVTLRVAEQDWSQYMFPWNWSSGSHGLNWDIGLNPTVPLALAFEIGASQAEIDLSGLRVTDLSIKTGASATQITLPANAGLTRARIEAGAASVDVRVPDSVAARIVARMGIGALSVDPRRFQRLGDAYETEGFSGAQNQVVLSIEGGVGTVSVS
jgi:hypothetical protein